MLKSHSSHLFKATLTVVSLLLLFPAVSQAAAKGKKKGSALVDDVWYADVQLGKAKAKKKARKSKTVRVACAEIRGKVQSGLSKRVKLSEKSGKYKFVTYKSQQTKLKQRANTAAVRKQLQSFKQLTSKGKKACEAAQEENGNGGEPNTESISFAPYTGTFGVREARVLYDRFAFGASRAELDAAVSRGLAATVEYLLTWRDESAREADAADVLCDEYLQVEETFSDDDGQLNRECNRYNPLDFDMEGLVQSYLIRFQGNNPFFYKFMTVLHSERMAAQIDGLPNRRRHFAVQHFQFLTGVSKALDYAYYLQYVKDDPLVAYQNLDLGENSVFNELTPPNENFAREWLELASMSPDNRSGQANYTPFDIAELALALSGRGYDTDEIPIGGGEFVEVENPVIKPAGFVPGPKTLFFGQPFETTIVDADDAADAILSHPETYTHMAEELLSNYLTPAPSNAAVQFIADQIQNDGGKLHNAFRKMMLSEELYSADNEKILPKSPMDILIGFLRKTGLKVNHRSLEDRLDDLGHSLGKPGNNQAGRIFGWKMLQLAGEGYVISRRNVVNRFMNDLRNSSYRENWGVDIYDLFVKDLPDGKPASEALVDSLVELLGVRINSAQKAQLIRYLDYNWENCDSYEVAEYGCTEGEKFAKREAFDPSPDAPSWLLEDKVLGLLAVLLTLDEFYLR